jgi:Zn-dependent protease
MTTIASIISIAVVVLLSMIIHEIAHGLVAFWLGDNTAKERGRLTLNPLKHLDPWLSIALPVLMAISGGPIMGGAKPVPIDSSRLKWGVWGMALTAIAGPVSNFILSFVAFAILALSGISVGFWSMILILFVQVNLGLMIFNLLPIPPLDGSRVLYALAPDGVRNLFNKIESMGLILVFILIFFAGTVLAQIVGGAENWIISELFPRLLFLK